jgi:hypothetical protein
VQDAFRHPCGAPVVSVGYILHSVRGTTDIRESSAPLAGLTKSYADANAVAPEAVEDEEKNEADADVDPIHITVSGEIAQPRTRGAPVLSVMARLRRKRNRSSNELGPHDLPPPTVGLGHRSQAATLSTRYVPSLIASKLKHSVSSPSLINSLDQESQVVVFE